MSHELDSLFQNRNLIVHPKLQYWIEKSHLPGVKKTVIEVSRPRDGLSFRPAKIYLHCYDAISDGKEVFMDTEDWDIDLNDLLIKEEIRAIDMNNEALRFTLMLTAEFKKPDTRYGDAYFSGVFGNFLNDSGLASDPTINEQLNKVAYNSPDKSTSTYSDCFNIVKSIVSNAATTLTDKLKYNRDQAEAILKVAVSNYLDERFSITNRRILGW